MIGILQTVRSLNLKDTKKVLKKLLQETFQYEKIDNPTFVKKYYWRNAVHFWKPNINEKQIHKKFYNSVKMCLSVEKVLV